MKKHAKDHKTSKECWASLKGLVINKEKGRSKEKLFPLFLLEARLRAGLVSESSGSANCCEVGRSLPQWPVSPSHGRHTIHGERLRAAEEDVCFL